LRASRTLFRVESGSRCAYHSSATWHWRLHCSQCMFQNLF
jgi:hypothetical protein